MKNSFAFLAGATAFVLMGAGCFGGGSTSTSGGIWQSSDAGKSFTQTSAVPTAEGVSSLADVDVTTFAIDPQDSSAIYAGTMKNGLFFSLDSGTSWQRPEEDLARTGQIVGIGVSSKDVCTYVVAKTDRVMHTSDCGRSFETDGYVETRKDTTITAMALDWYDPKIVWIGTSSGDVIRSVDGGSSFATLARLDDAVTTIAVSNADSRTVFVGTKNSGLNRTTDSGATWTNFEKTLKEFKGSDRVYGFAQNSDGSFMVMSSKYGLLSSTDHGATWSGVSLISGTGEVHIYGLSVAAEGADTIYYATDTTFNRSTSAGSAWTTTELPSSRGGAAILVDPSDSTHVYLGSATVSSK